MARFRTVRLLLHLGRHRVDYALVLRTADGRDTTDRRLSWGQLPLPDGPEGPEALLPLLQRVVYDLCRKHGLHDSAQRSGAPGGGGGRTDPDPEDTLPLFVISRDGQTLDSDGNPL